MKKIILLSCADSPFGRVRFFQFILEKIFSPCYMYNMTIKWSFSDLSDLKFFNVSALSLNFHGICSNRMENKTGEKGGNGN